MFGPSPVSEWQALMVDGTDAVIKALFGKNTINVSHQILGCSVITGHFCLGQLDILKPGIAIYYVEESLVVVVRFLG